MRPCEPFNPKITTEQARWIRVLRRDIGCSIHRIAGLAYQAAPESFPSPHPVAGRKYLTVAADMLGEAVDDWERGFDSPRHADFADRVISVAREGAANGWTEAWIQLMDRVLREGAR